ncbi:MAG: methyl-accepting chemotaxis protein, partial [Pseudomonadota bacterium]
MQPRRLTVSRLVLAVIVGFSALVALPMSINILDETRRYGEVTDLAAANQATVFWSKGTLALSLERSVTQVALSVAGPVPPAFLTLIDEQRAKSDGLFDRALAGIEVPPTASQQAFIDAANQARGSIAALRTEVDALFAVTRAERSAERMEAIPFEMKRQISLMQTTTAYLAPPSSVLSDISTALSTLQNRAWEVREFGGRARTYYAIAVLNGTRLPDDIRSLLLADEKRAAAAWRAIQVITATNDLPADLAEAIGTGERLYLQDYQALTTQMAAASDAATDGPPAYPMDFEGFFARSSKALEHMTALSEGAGLAQNAYWHERLQASGIALAFVIGELVLIVVLGWVAYRVLHARLIERLRTTTVALGALAAGDLDVELDRKPNDLDDVDRLITALEVFRDRMRSFDTDMRETLEGVLSRAERSTVSVAEVAAELEGLAGRMNDGASSQASAARRAADAIGEISGAIRQSAGNADETETVARGAAEKAERSGDAVRSAVDAMGRIA